MSKSKLSFLAPVLLFAVGAGIFLYPAISNLIVENEQRNNIYSYKAAIDQKSADELALQWEMARTYNENLSGQPIHDPFVIGSGYVLPDNYLEVLNVGKDGMMGYIDIPKIDVYLPIYHGTSEEVLSKYAGHLEESSLPIGSDSSHCVISAHRGLPSALLFTELDKLKKGDVFYLHVLDKVLAYQVDKIDVIEPKDISILEIVTGEDYVTLLTCTPYGINTHRLLVRGTRIPYKKAKEVQKTTIPHGIWFSIYMYVVPLTVIIIVVIWFVWRKKRKAKEVLLKDRN